MKLDEKFSKFLSENLPKAPSFHPHYEEALGYMLKAGGKHFRANLLLCIVDSINPKLTESAMRVALGLEMLHTYSLIHDDLPAMDNSPLRRGQPTLHIKYDEVTAILVADALNTDAFYMICKSDLPDDIRIKCIEILSQNGGSNGMVLGQAIDCYFEKKYLNLEQLKFLHIHKTGKLIAASLKIGAVIAGMNDKDIEKIYDIGLDLGLAFQIQDDIIDATSSEENAGKPVNNDCVKNSFTNLLGIEGAIQARDELIFKIKDKLQFNFEISRVILNLINKHFKLNL